MVDFTVGILFMIEGHPAENVMNFKLRDHLFYAWFYPYGDEYKMQNPELAQKMIE